MYHLRAIRGARPARNWSQSVVHLCLEKVFSKHKTNEEGRKIHLSRRFFRQKFASVLLSFRINGDLDDIADDDSAFTSEALQLKLFVCGYQHQERRRLANVHSGSGTVPKRIRDLERPSRDEE